MSSFPPAANALPDALLAAFISFPAPLALLDGEGRTTLVNSRFFVQFAAAAPDAAARRGNSDAWAAAGGASALHLLWQEGYECGDPTIDGEHQELFRLANVLIDASLQQPQQPGVMNELIEDFLTHVQRHFADEEAILARLQYDHLVEHKRAHAGLVRRALWMAERFETGEGSVGDLVEFLAQDVVARHLIAVDRAFFPLFAAAAGASPPAPMHA